MTELTKEQREEFAEAWQVLDARDAEIEAARRPLDEQLEPFLRQSMQVEEDRESLIERMGAKFAGKCEVCGKPLFEGEQGSRPYEDDTGIVYCAEHGLTYGDIKENWSHMPPEEDDEDLAETRKGAMELVESHLAAGGALTDLAPTYPL